MIQQTLLTTHDFNSYCFGVSGDMFLYGDRSRVDSKVKNVLFFCQKE